MSRGVSAWNGSSFGEKWDGIIAGRYTPSSDGAESFIVVR